jgi:membrane fusion protein (multidrug efflux system)
VTAGLQPGTHVIINNLQKLREGAPVDPHPAPQPAPASPSSNTTPATAR